MECLFNIWQVSIQAHVRGTALGLACGGEAVQMRPRLQGTLMNIRPDSSNTDFLPLSFSEAYDIYYYYFLQVFDILLFFSTLLSHPLKFWPVYALHDLLLEMIYFFFYSWSRVQPYIVQQVVSESVGHKQPESSLQNRCARTLGLRLFWSDTFLWKIR